jgi:hypothetical protein
MPPLLSAAAAAATSPALTAAVKATVAAATLWPPWPARAAAGVARLAVRGSAVVAAAGGVKTAARITGSGTVVVIAAATGLAAVARSRVPAAGCDGSEQRPRAYADGRTAAAPAWPTGLLPAAFSAALPRRRRRIRRSRSTPRASCAGPGGRTRAGQQASSAAASRPQGEFAARAGAVDAVTKATLTWSRRTVQIMPLAYLGRQPVSIPSNCFNELILHDTRDFQAIVYAGASDPEGGPRAPGDEQNSRAFPLPNPP